jgi:hypothetical protein
MSACFLNKSDGVIPSSEQRLTLFVEAKDLSFK